MTLFEEISNMLTEISAEDAYAKFYSKIPKDDFDKIVNFYGKFDSIVKFILKGIMTWGMSTDECISILAKYKALNNKARIIISDKIKKNEYSDIEEFIDDINNEENLIKNTKSGLSKNGYEVLYKDENWILTATYTYEANHKYFGYTHWCTASDRLGSYDGYEYFLEYTNGEALLQITNATNKNETYQLEATKQGRHLEVSQICDIKDTSMDFAELKGIVGDEIFFIIDQKLQMCIDKTRSMKYDEKVYQESMEKQLEERKKRVKIRAQQIKEKAKQLNFEIAQKILQNARTIEIENLQMDANFLNSLSKLSKYSKYDLANVEETDPQFFKDAEANKNAFIGQMKFISENIAIVYIIVKTPIIYFSEMPNGYSIPKLTEGVSADLVSYLDEHLDYHSRGFIVVAEIEGNRFSRVIRELFNVNDDSGETDLEARINNGVMGTSALDFLDTHKKSILYFDVNHKGRIYTPSNGKIYDLNYSVESYSTIHTNGMMIYFTKNDCIAISDKNEMAFQLKGNNTCIKCDDYGIIINNNSKDNMSNKGAQLYVNDDFLPNGTFVFDRQIDMRGEGRASNGIYAIQLYDMAVSQNCIVIDSNNKTIKPLFDFDSHLNNLQIYKNDNGSMMVFSILSTINNDGTGGEILCCDLPSYKYSLISKGGRTPCDMYGNTNIQQAT